MLRASGTILASNNKAQLKAVIENVIGPRELYFAANKSIGFFINARKRSQCASECGREGGRLGKRNGELIMEPAVLSVCNRVARFLACRTDRSRSDQSFSRAKKTSDPGAPHRHYRSALSFPVAYSLLSLFIVGRARIAEPILRSIRVE